MTDRVACGRRSQASENADVTSALPSIATNSGVFARLRIWLALANPRYSDCRLLILLP